VIFATACFYQGAVSAYAGEVSLNESERIFIWDEASSIVMSAKTSDDFLRAYQAYSKLDRAGVKNGYLYYNMGTCLLKAKEYDKAAAMFTRAERYLGNNRDNRNNLMAAISGSRKDTANVQQLPWSRFLMFWHYSLPCHIRLTLAVFGFAGIWAALAARLLGLRWIYRNLMTVSAVIFIIFGSSALTTIHQEARSERILIAAPDAETTAPSNSTKNRK
jgi:tetratricopeptide (TPR) repeat protein